ncbi:hypothetical protein AAHE18_03G338700 [Arachis hypogaea]
MASLHHHPLPYSEAKPNNSIVLEIHHDETITTTSSAVAHMEEASRKSNGEEKSNPICLTWKDLWVRASMGKRGTKAILQGLTGYAKPGQLLAIMGPSGCGKSTLLDTLAGRLGSNTRQTGEILVNGHKQSLAYGSTAYVTQDDTLITSLTVREAVYYSAQLQLPDSMSKAEKKERAEFTIREMGLQDAINTRIGGWGCKGISGGQKRRVSICIEILTRPRLLFLDEPTSGLDSAASYYVMKRIKSLDHKDGIQRTIIASIHQPSAEVFQFFDNLCLLSAGKTVYFGPASDAIQFFASNGFPCPALQNPSDHLLKTINKDFDQEMEVGVAGTSGGALPAEAAIGILVNAYKASEINEQVQTEVTAISKMETSSVEKKRGHASFLRQCIVLTKRSFVNMSRDLGYYWLRLAIYIALAISLATIFYHLDTSYASIKRVTSCICIHFHNFHEHWWIPFLCGRYEGIRKRKAKWALWCECVCDRKYLISHPICVDSFFHSGSYSILPPWSPEWIRPLPLLHLCSIFLPHVSGEPHDDSCKRGSKLPHGNHTRLWNTRHHDLSCWLLQTAKHHS